jgi:branched-chain amino acid transport system substrate-binding protein
VMAKMREMPVNDFFAKNGRVREDGRFIHDMYVYEVKKPSESKYPWDYYKLRATIPRRSLPSALRKQMPARKK